MDGIRLNESVVRGFVGSSKVASWGVLIFALAMLLTWMLGMGPLTAPVLSAIGMRAGAALACALVAAAALLSGRAPLVSILLSLLAAMLGVLELLGTSLLDGHWLHQLLPVWPQRPSPRMNQFGAVAFVLLGVIGLLAVLRRLTVLREASAIAVITIALAAGATYGQVLGGGGTGLPRQLPLITAALQFLLVLGWMASVPTTGMTRVAVADSIGGAFARRLILPSLLLPVLLTFLLSAMSSRFNVPESAALTMASIATGGAVASMIIWVARLLDRAERQRRTVHSLQIDASTDGLTGIANRRALDAAMEQSVRSPAPFAVLLLDLDHFKSFNDSFGHKAGDDVLRAAGQLLRGAVRPQDLVARYGGEEFVVVLHNGNAQGALQVGQRILAAFRGHAWLSRPVTVSIGAAVVQPGESAEALLQRADDAMYRSKQAGRDRLTVDAETAGGGPGLAEGTG